MQAIRTTGPTTPSDPAVSDFDNSRLAPTRMSGHHHLCAHSGQAMSSRDTQPS